MNNKVVVETFHTFMDNDFSVCRVNFRGVGKSDGEFDNGQGELADAAAALDWLERENFDNSQCWVSGFSFGSLIAMQLLMRRPEINRFIAISPQPNVYDFSFLSPCPSSGMEVVSQGFSTTERLCPSLSRRRSSTSLWSARCLIGEKPKWPDKSVTAGAVT